MIASGLSASSCARNSGLLLIFSGWVTAKPKSRARCFTGEKLRSRPRPRGLSGCVTTNLIWNPAPTSFSKVGTANCGVPQKTRFKDVFIGGEDYRINDLPMRPAVNILKIMTYANLTQNRVLNGPWTRDDQNHVLGIKRRSWGSRTPGNGILREGRTGENSRPGFFARPISVSY
jgi:hypothetical protein